MTSALEDLGRHLAAEQDALLARDATQLARVRHRVLSPPPARVPLGRGVALAGGLLAVGAVLALVLALGPGAAADLGYALGDGTAGRVGATLVAADEPLTLAFTDGSSVTVAPDAALTVASLDERGASLVLDRGRASFAVTPGHATRWTVGAGRFTVHVTGTRFELAWSPRRGELALDLSEGHVLVTGPLLGQGRSVMPGERVRVSLVEERVEFGAAAPASAATSPDGDAAGGGARGDDGAERGRGPARAGLDAASTPAAPRRPAAAGAVGAEAPGGVGMPPVPDDVPGAATRRDWRELAADGRYRDAMAQVEQRGFAALVGEARADGLSALGDTARLAGDWERARVAYLALRERYPGTREALGAAFFLGRIDFDRRRAFLEAASWFERYLDEAPEGSFAPQALGRLVEAWQRAGEGERAREAARTYLERYPAGPHAGLARQVLTGER